MSAADPEYIAFSCPAQLLFDLANTVDSIASNTRVPRVRSRTARSESLLPTFRATVMRLLIARCIFRRNGPTIQIAWKLPMCPPMPALRPNQSLRRK